MGYLKLVFLVFAVYRLALLISTEEGPYFPIGPLKNEFQIGLFERLRQLVGAYDYAENGRPLTNLARGISCPLCVGGYVSILLIAFTWTDSVAANIIVGWLGVWGIQVFLTKVSTPQ